MEDNNVTNVGTDTTEVSTSYDGYEDYPAEKPSKKFVIGAAVTVGIGLIVGGVLAVKNGVLKRRQKTQEALDEVFDEPDEYVEQPLEESEQPADVETVDKPKPSTRGGKK